MSPDGRPTVVVEDRGGVLLSGPTKGQVVVDRCVPQLGGEVLDLRLGRTGNVDADINTAQSCDGFVDRPTDLRRVGHTGDNRDGITSCRRSRRQCDSRRCLSISIQATEAPASARANDVN
jgi:hypothetical protein